MRRERQKRHNRAFTWTTLLGLAALGAGCEPYVSGTAGVGATSTGQVLVPTGEASAGEVLFGKEFYSSAGSRVIGTMPIGGNLTGPDGSVNFLIALGYYDGTKSVTAVDTDLLAANIRSNVNIFGTVGTLIPKYSDCVDDALNVGSCSTSPARYVTGTLGGAVNGADGSPSRLIPAGYYDGSTSCSMSDTDLVAGNILKSATIFGVTGSIDNWGNLDASLAYKGPGYYGSLQNAPAATSICEGAVVFGTAGTVHCAGIPASNALRGPLFPSETHLSSTVSNSLQLSQKSEAITYAGAQLPSGAGGYTYRDIPDQAADDDGQLGTSAGYAVRPSVDCGTSGSISFRISDCLAKNPSSATWDGAKWGNGGQGEWKLVSRTGVNKEVWRDERTQLLWSSVSGTTANWCRASGNQEQSPVTFVQAFNSVSGIPMSGGGRISGLSGGHLSLDETVTIRFTSATDYDVVGSGGGCNGTGTIATGSGSTASWSRAGYCSFTLEQSGNSFAINDTFVLRSVAASRRCSPGGALQSAPPMSYCAQIAGGTPGFAGETWGAGANYPGEKGGMGLDRSSPDKVAWRLPTIADYQLANINGIRMVMPDMGIAGTERPTHDISPGGAPQGEWSATVRASDRGYAWYFDSVTGATNSNPRETDAAIRCVGR